MKAAALANQVIILFLLMLVGFIARKKRLLNNELNALLTIPVIVMLV